MNTCFSDDEYEAGRKEYYDGTPYDFGRTVWWCKGWREAANMAALELKSLRATVSGPDMIRRCVCDKGVWSDDGTLLMAPGEAAAGRAT